MENNILGAFLVGLLVSFLAMPLIIGALRRKNLIDSPDRRKIHRSITPSMGGIGIMAGLLISLLIWLTFGGIVEYKYVLAGIGILFITGLRDDLIPISPRIKLMAQILAALIVIFNGTIIDSGFGLFGITELNFTIRVFLSVGFIIFFTNSFNLIDGLDGLASSVALIISLFFSIWFYMNESFYLAVISAATAGSLIGFLYYNWSPAKIFMGDTGSLSLGFLFSTLAIIFINQDYALSNEPHKYNAPIATMISILVIPLFDTIRIIVVRLVKKKSPFEPDNNHTHHILMRLGLSHAQVAILLTSVNVAVIGFVTYFRNVGDNILLPIIILSGFFMSVLLDQLIIRKVKTRGGRQRRKIQKSINSNNSY